MEMDANLTADAFWVSIQQLLHPPFTRENQCDTILTPFSISPMTDMAVDSLPALFLAYCTLAESDDVLSIDDRVAPWGSALDPVLLLINCAFGLGPSFLSCSRR
jgi:hypothetical protein